MSTAPSGCVVHGECHVGLHLNGIGHLEAPCLDDVKRSPKKQAAHALLASSSFSAAAARRRSEGLSRGSGSSICERSTHACKSPMYTQTALLCMDSGRQRHGTSAMAESPERAQMGSCQIHVRLALDQRQGFSQSRRRYWQWKIRSPRNVCGDVRIGRLAISSSTQQADRE